MRVIVQIEAVGTVPDDTSPDELRALEGYAWGAVEDALGPHMAALTVVAGHDLEPIASRAADAPKGGDRV